MTTVHDAAVPEAAVAGLSQTDVVLQGIKLGAKYYIRKPFHPTELVKLLQKHLPA